MVALELAASWRKRIALAPFSRRMSLAAACLTFEQLLHIPAHYFADCRSFWPLRQVVPSCQQWLPSCTSRAAACWVLVQQTILGSRCTHEVSLQEFEEVKAIKGMSELAFMGTGHEQTEGIQVDSSWLIFSVLSAMATARTTFCWSNRDVTRRQSISCSVALTRRTGQAVQVARAGPAGCIVPLGASNMMRSIQQLLGIHVSWRRRNYMYM